MSAPCEICAKRQPLYFHSGLIAALCESCKTRPAPWFVDLRKRETNAQRRQREEKRSTFVGTVTRYRNLQEKSA